ncbi:uncharacterized protein TNCV_4620461 [Trichonephila clavipes]|nr:uncharacterized protein TNCV_4620461 [Trichonephila clavipes]
MDGSQISCAALRASALNSREQLIREQWKYPELGHIYRYLKNPDDDSVIATVCEGRRVVGKFTLKFEGPYRVLEVRNNNLILWKKRRRVTVNIDQVRVHHPRQSDTNSFDSTNETLYEGKGSSNGSSRSHPGKSKSSRKTSGDESKSRKSNKGTAGLEDLRLKR